MYCNVIDLGGGGGGLEDGEEDRLLEGRTYIRIHYPIAILRR